MNNKFIILLILLFFTKLLNVFSQEEYYYYGGERIPLYRDSNSVIIYFKENFIFKNRDSTFNNPSIVEFEATDGYVEIYMARITTSIPIINIPTFLSTMNISISELQGYSYGYLTIDGDNFWPAMEVAFRLKEEIVLDSVKSILNSYNAIYISQDYGVYSYFIPNINDVFDLANLIFENGFVKWAEPNFYCKNILCTDPYYAEQYYLNNIGQTIGGAIATNDVDIDAPDAWALSSGSSNIKVAVLDDGVEEHEDLKDANGDSRVLTGYTPGCISGCDGRPRKNGRHGQLCAGVIAASHNEIGGRGIAPNVNIIPINVAHSDAHGKAKAIGKAWDDFDADIISCSMTFQPPSNKIADAIQIARANGRNGKGTVFVASSGNHNDHIVKFPARVPGVISVGAIDLNGILWNYSCRGAELSLVAPSGDAWGSGDIITTDREGDKGYVPDVWPDNLSNENYTSGFGGTSATCPQAAGVAALLLSVDPTLTEPEVYCRMTINTVDIGAPGRDDDMGYGRLNAYYTIALNDMVIHDKVFEGVQKFATKNTVTIGPSCTFKNSAPYLANIEVTARTKIIALPGSKCEAGTYFHAYISPQGPCGSGPFKYNSLNNDTNIIQEEIIQKKLITAFNLYPNPNNGTFIIEYEFAETELGTIEIYDITGREVLSETLKSGKNTLPINASELDAGVYFYQAVVGNKRVAGDKIVVIK